MTGQARRAQLLDVARGIFANRGFEATSVEEIAHRADVSKPVVYEHFGGKEGIYAVIVDREVSRLMDRITTALTGDDPRQLVQQAALAFLTYIEEEPDGFRILVRDSPVTSSTGTLASLIGDIATQAEQILAAQFKATGYDPRLAPLYSQALVGMVALVGQWWLDSGKPSKDVVAAHLVNLAWNGLKDLDKKPEVGPADARKGPSEAPRS
ncbi:MAG: TetR/AcrR family transcriptional regulator [Actinomycetota bacterium]|nr:TetR/AcrR family transcriptional regulator [Actinomycetota bacterium]